MTRPFLQRGIALVMVLWFATLLAVIASSFVFSTRTDTQLAQNAVALARAQAAADAGVQRAIFELFLPAGNREAWKADGAPHQWEFGEAKLVVTLLDESAKIDLNTAGEPLLLGLFKGAGLNGNEAAALLDAVLDWRDSDDLRRPNGAEAPEYKASGLKIRPSNAPFETIDELRRVLGMRPEVYSHLESVLTVHSRLGDIYSAIAPRQVLLALPGAQEEQVDAYLARRKAALDANLPPPPFPSLAGSGASASGSVFSVRAEAVLPDGTTFIRDAVVKWNPGIARKVIYLSWKEGVRLPVAGTGVNSTPSRK